MASNAGVGIDPATAIGNAAVAEISVATLRMDGDQLQKTTIVQRYEVVLEEEKNAEGSTVPPPAPDRGNIQFPQQTVPNSGAAVPPRSNDQRFPETRRHRRPHTGPISNGGRRVPPPTDLPRSYHDRLQSRCCNCCLVFIFVIGLALMVMSIATFALKDADVRKNCANSSCSLSSCDKESTHIECAVVYSGGGVMCLVYVLFVVSLAVRTCYGVKVLGPCIVGEVCILIITLAVATLVIAYLSLGIETNKSCLRDRCKGHMDIDDLFDFMKQSEIAAMLSWLTMLALVFVWILLCIGTCCDTNERRRGPQGEAEPLLPQN